MKKIYIIYTPFLTPKHPLKKKACVSGCAKATIKLGQLKQPFAARVFFEVGPRTTSCKWGYIPYIPFNNLKTFNTSSLGFWMTSDPRQKFFSTTFHHARSLDDTSLKITETSDPKIESGCIYSQVYQVSLLVFSQYHSY